MVAGLACCHSGKIQREVEGFSVIAIGYYLLGVLKVVVRACWSSGQPFDYSCRFRF
ncbi:DUF3422 family protein [Rhizobium sp. 57MFTsu3.2]|uniref:DUF3422 family protein n=1 Tax=unclassified Rhizobium TaxID=2613769 RepID=UPI0032B2730E